MAQNKNAYITPEKLERINRLARKSKAEGLTEQEKKEQTALRNEYRMSVVGNLASQLDNTYIVNPDGSKQAVKNRFKK